MLNFIPNHLQTASFYAHGETYNRKESVIGCKLGPVKPSDKEPC